MNKDERDEAYMQDAIDAAKSTGRLHEINPKDAPAPVKPGGFAAKHRSALPKSTPDAELSAEDKAFSEVEKLQARRQQEGEQSRSR